MPANLCPKLCKECPFRRASAQGYLGECLGDPWEFLRAHFIEGEVPLPCHMTVDWQHPNAQKRAKTAPMCRGFVTFMRNTCKLPRDPEIAALVREVEPDRDTVFASLNEFLLHHHNESLQAGRFR